MATFSPSPPAFIDTTPPPPRTARSAAVLDTSDEAEEEEPRKARLVPRNCSTSDDTKRGASREELQVRIMMARTDRDQTRHNGVRTVHKQGKVVQTANQQGSSRGGLLDPILTIYTRLDPQACPRMMIHSGYMPYSKAFRVHRPTICTSGILTDLRVKGVEPGYDLRLTRGWSPTDQEELKTAREHTH